MFKRIGGWFRFHGRKLAGILFLAFGGMVFFIWSLFFWGSLYGIFYGSALACVSAVAFLAAVGLLAPPYIKRQFDAQQIGSLAQWQEVWTRWQRYLLRGLVAGFLVAALLSFIRAVSGHGDDVYWLVATIWMAVTVVLLFGAVYALIWRLFYRSLPDLWAMREEETKGLIDTAVEKARQSMARAAKSERLKVDLISNVSHDLKTPLTSMVGYIELLKKQELDETSADYVEIIDNRAEKLKEMIESLFDLAKASSGNVRLSQEPMQLNRLVEQLLADMDDAVAESGLSVIRLLTTEDTGLVSDPGYLYRICQNLMENALKYSAKGTRIFLKTYLSADMVHLDVINTAGYLMDFQKEDILERFARGDKERTTEGNGLGLAIVSTYTGALGGTFDISLDCDQFKACLAFPRAAVAETTATDAAAPGLSVNAGTAASAVAAAPGTPIAAGAYAASGTPDLSAVSTGTPASTPAATTPAYAGTENGQREKSQP